MEVKGFKGLQLRYIAITFVCFILLFLVAFSLSNDLNVVKKIQAYVSITGLFLVAFFLVRMVRRHDVVLSEKGISLDGKFSPWSDIDGLYECGFVGKYSIGMNLRVIYKDGNYIDLGKTYFPYMGLSVWGYPVPSPRAIGDWRCTKDYDRIIHYLKSCKVKFIPNKDFSGAAQFARKSYKIKIVDVENIFFRLRN